jgi:hypothetical protein
LQLLGAILYSQAAGVGCQNCCIGVASNQHFCVCGRGWNEEHDVKKS